MPHAPFATPPSATLVGGLCHEMDHLRRRAMQLGHDLAHCRQESLLLRLRAEGEDIRRRRRELQRSAALLQSMRLRDPLGVAFLVEVCRRPLEC